MKTNPLPGHNGSIVNAIEEFEHFALVKEVKKMKASTTVVRKKLLNNGFLACLHDNYEICLTK